MDGKKRRGASARGSRPAGRAGSKGVQSVEVGLRLIEALAAAPAALPLKQLSERAGLAPSKAHRYLASFARAGLVVQDPTTTHYDLGPLALRLGHAAQARLDPVQHVLDEVERLASDSGHTALAGVWTERGPMILRWVQGPRAVYTTLSVGSLMPLLRSATGQVFLAYLRRHELEPLLSLDRVTWASARVATLRESVRIRGYAEVSGDLIPGLHAIAAPVLDSRGELVAALTLVAAGSGGLTRGANDALLAATRRVSTLLGHRGRDD